MKPMTSSANTENSREHSTKPSGCPALSRIFKHSVTGRKECFVTEPLGNPLETYLFSSLLSASFLYNTDQVCCHDGRISILWVPFCMSQDGCLQVLKRQPIKKRKLIQLLLRWGRRQPHTFWLDHRSELKCTNNQNLGLRRLFNAVFD